MLVLYFLRFCGSLQAREGDMHQRFTGKLRRYIGGFLQTVLRTLIEFPFL